MLENDDQRVLPKVAVRTVLEESRLHNNEQRTVYDVEYATKSISGGDSYAREIIGYVETEPYTQFDRCEDFSAFVDQVETKSRYHSWVPQRFTHEEKAAFGGDPDGE